MKPQYIKIDDKGDTQYYSDKAMTIKHRDNGPAVERKTGTKFWYHNGKLHRTDGPAQEWSSGSKFWYRNGVAHREDGPAVEWNNGNKVWYIDGLQLTEAEFKARKAPHNGKKVMVGGIEYTLNV